MSTQRNHHPGAVRLLQFSNYLPERGLALSAGTRLGPYEILSPLGVGGMGEVYRARDSKLGRSVAIKALPSDVARDREKLDRCRLEAKVLASPQAFWGGLRWASDGNSVAYAVLSQS